MRYYSVEFKLECIRKYIHGEKLNRPPDIKDRYFKNMVLKWVKLYNTSGESALSRVKPPLTDDQVIGLVLRVLNGESMNEVAYDVGRDSSQISQWVKAYLQGNLDGVKFKKRGRKPSMKKKTSPIKSEFDKLKKENEYLRAENEYLKKLRALVQERIKDQSQKRK